MLDLNQRPLGYEPNELPDCSTPHIHSSNRFGVGQTRRVHNSNINTDMQTICLRLAGFRRDSREFDMCNRGVCRRFCCGAQATDEPHLIDAALFWTASPTESAQLDANGRRRAEHPEFLLARDELGSPHMPRRKRLCRLDRQHRSQEAADARFHRHSQTAR